MTPEEFKQTENREYSAWFGNGDTHGDYYNEVAEDGEPKEVFEGCDEDSKFMLCLIYEDEVVVVGYDNSEYCHKFIFKAKKRGREL